MPMSKREVEQLLKQPNVAVVAVTAPDGAPHAVPTWYEYRGGEIVFHTGLRTFKYRCLAHDPRITLVIDTRKPPYKAVILKGRVSMTEDFDDARLKRMSVAYLGKKNGEAYAKSMAGEKTVIVRFKPERTISWDYGKVAP
ncbi:MAG TPA: TIGR03618 family F420-dependent PPOX class oxidoreductase [Candidatus Binataceae bacterium]|nr:TIGR03618 family F420-dependent PPOX class oxidoreductase [Candidatus Binataceae bacterium]